MTLDEQHKIYLEKFVTIYPDFPGVGINFQDLSLLYTDSNCRKIMQNYFSWYLNSLKQRPDCVIGCDARGFIIGTLISQVMDIPLVLARKPGKLPGELLKREYGLEYGKSELQMHKHIISKYNSPVIADDVLATGGTVIAVTQMLEEIGVEVFSYNS